jgi:hypothetical protein
MEDMYSSKTSFQAVYSFLSASASLGPVGLGWWDGMGWVGGMEWLGDGLAGFSTSGDIAAGFLDPESRSGHRATQRSHDIL